MSTSSNEQEKEMEMEKETQMEQENEKKKDTAEEMLEIVEGTAKMLYNKKEAVFYNKVQVR